MIALLVLMMGVNFDAEAQLGGLLNKVTGGSKADKKKQSINLMAVRIFLQTKDSFDRDIKTIGKHISNALQEESSNIPTVAKFATVGIENGRSVTRQVEYYNLDISFPTFWRKCVFFQKFPT